MPSLYSGATHSLIVRTDMTDATTELREFYNYIWGEEPTAEITFVYLPVEHESKWTPFMFEWPRQREGVIRHTLKWSAIKANVFF